MLKYLEEVEYRLPTLLREGEWHDKYVTYEKPYVERLWMQDGENRIYLHRIHKCRGDEAYFHKHSWPTAMKVLAGSYKMSVGFDTGTTHNVSTVVLAPGSTYEMTNSNAMHSVNPVDFWTLSLMVSGPAWDIDSAMSRVKKPVNPDLTLSQRQQLMQDFLQLYPKIGY